ncbi:diaminopimelate epimerase [Micromonospora sp. DT4]|uniref:diaminopimelate epimerase n=1 Tax=Micromonospora sp. DT4 TaxID=3393438 RepID=UPI003CEF9565
MHGAGNDFVVLDLRHGQDPSPGLCRALADRHAGVGCDLILGVKAPRSAQAVASFEIWTADGSPSRQCGNGARCIAAWVLRAGLARGPRFTIDSPAGTHGVDVLTSQLFSIMMGQPQFTPEQIPVFGFDNEQSLYDADLDDGLHLEFSAVSMGNPHAVIEVESLATAPVSQVGRALQSSRYFPPTVNVGFAEIIARDHIGLRVYEYGAGETLACGSGACAAAAVLMRRGRIDRKVTVTLPGGNLDIDWSDVANEMVMTGPAEFVYEGQFLHVSGR